MEFADEVLFPLPRHRGQQTAGTGLQSGAAGLGILAVDQVEQPFDRRKTWPK